MAVKKKAVNILSPRTATVNYSMGGLTIEIKDVPAVDAGLVSQALMNTARKLAILYPELVEGLSSAHSSPIEQEEELDGEDYVLPPVAKRKLGFTP